MRFDFVLTSWSGRQHPLNQTLSYGAAGRSGAWVAEVLGRWERRKMRCTSRFDPLWGRWHAGPSNQAVGSHRQRAVTPRTLVSAGDNNVEQAKEVPHREDQLDWKRNQQTLLIQDNLVSTSLP